MKKVRVTAAITANKYGGYRVVLSNGVYSDYPTLQDAQSYANYKNNEDADDPEYMYVEDDVHTNSESETSLPYYERERMAREERKQKQEEREENNRNSKKASDKYIYVVSCNLRGESGVVYLQSETDLTKITKKYGGGLITTKETEAKAFKTKAAAQKHIDNLSKCWVTKSLFRSMNVVQKRKDKMGVK